eukprot:14181-Heterococcus_DN1.PRE.3
MSDDVYAQRRWIGVHRDPNSLVKTLITQHRDVVASAASKKVYTSGKQCQSSGYLLHRVHNTAVAETVLGHRCRSECGKRHQRQRAQVNTDAGRVCRPLFVVDKNQLVVRKHHIHQLRNNPTDYTWNTLMQAGAVEYVDTEVSLTVSTVDVLKYKLQQCGCIAGCLSHCSDAKYCAVVCSVAQMHARNASSGSSCP